MNKIKFLATAILLLAGTTVGFAASKTDSIKVSGNCGMCEKNIETAAKKAGAKKAKWDEETKILVVTYDDAKTSNDAIQKKIAEVGYDTDKYVGDEKAYNSLHACCQYDGKRKS
jgi:periplasmic mercuric ion binding protein